MQWKEEENKFSLILPVAALVASVVNGALLKYPSTREVRGSRHARGGFENLKLFSTSSSVSYAPTQQYCLETNSFIP